MTANASGKSEAEMKAEIAKLEAELKSLNAKVAQSQAKVDAHEATAPRAEAPAPAPAKSPRRRGGKGKKKDAVAAARAEVARIPSNAQCRMDLAKAYEDADRWREAYAEASTAKQLIPTYGKAWRAKQRLEKLLDAAEIPFDDPHEPFLDTQIDAVPVDDDDAPAAPTAATVDEAETQALAQKKLGDGHFLAKRHDEAVRHWTWAVELRKQHGLAVDAKLYSNLAAAHLALKSHVSAARHGQLAIEADEGWWKGHWYFGQATLELVKASAKQRGACTSNGERAQEAYRAFVKAADCAPASKRAEVEAVRDATQQKIYEMTNQEGCVVC